MMRALIFGGMEAVYSTKQERAYNPFGCFEMDREQTRPKDYFSLPERKGKVMKVMYRQLYKLLPDRKYRIAFMVRNPKDIKRSQELVFGCAIPPAHDPAAYWHEIEQAQEKLIRMPNVEFEVIHADHLIYQPHDVFSKLRDKGWPIEPHLAAEAIEPKHWKAWGWNG